MRLEKGLQRWKSDLLNQVDPLKAGLDRCVDISEDFIGRRGRAARTLKKRLVTLEIGCRHAPAQGGSWVTRDGRVVGSVTSGDWGHLVGRNLAFANLDADLPGDDPGPTVDILGALIDARQTLRCFYDPGTTRCRS